MYDLAAASVFLRMDESTSQTLLGAYDGKPNATLPARFSYYRRFVAVMCGSIMLCDVARRAGHTGATGDERLDSTPSLADFYRSLQSGTVTSSNADRLWTFGLALIKESVAM